jgi:hypothetical protein
MGCHYEILLSVALDKGDVALIARDHAQMIDPTTYAVHSQNNLASVYTVTDSVRL